MGIFRHAQWIGWRQGKINSSAIPNSLRFLHFFPLHSRKYVSTFQNLTSASAPEPSGTWPRYLHRNSSELHLTSLPEPSRTWPNHCTGTFRNLTSASSPEPSGTWPRYLHQNLHLTSVPEPSRTWPGYVHSNPPEPHLGSAPEPSRTSPNLCTRTFRNLT